MASVGIDIKIKLSDIIMKDREAAKRIDFAMQAGMFIIEKAYVREAPADKGASGFQGGIQVEKNTPLDYLVKSTAKRRGFNYPLALFTGTGRLRGKPDFGYTSGRVRAGQVAKGIGGIRPNKAALRAKNKSQQEFINFVSSKIKLD